MAKTTTVKKDIIPYEAGVVILTPLDDNKQPDYTRSVRTEYDFLTSTQTSMTRTMETLANGNGQDKDYPTDESYTVTVTGNTYNPVFHAVVTGRLETLPETVLMPTSVSGNLPTSTENSESGLSITFGPSGTYPLEPAPDENGKYFLIVQDSYGNVLVRRDTPELGAYTFDEEQKIISFSDDYAGSYIQVTYKHEVKNAIQYKSNPIIQNPEYKVEIYGTRQSASSGATYNGYVSLERATATGDITDQTTQKSKSAPITYTFTSSPVPVGTSVYTEILVPTSDATSSDDNAEKNIPNGVQDSDFDKNDTSTDNDTTTTD